jgi:hypothetical protein
VCRPRELFQFPGSMSFKDASVSVEASVRGTLGSSNAVFDGVSRLVREGNSFYSCDWRQMMWSQTVGRGSYLWYHSFGFKSS